MLSIHTGIDSEPLTKVEIQPSFTGVTWFFVRLKESHSSQDQTNI